MMMRILILISTNWHICPYKEIGPYKEIQNHCEETHLKNAHTRECTCKLDMSVFESMCPYWRNSHLTMFQICINIYAPMSKCAGVPPSMEMNVYATVGSYAYI